MCSSKLADKRKNNSSLIISSPIKMSIPEIVESSLKEYHKEHLKDKLSVDEIYDIAKKYNFKIKDNIEKSQ